MRTRNAAIFISLLFAVMACGKEEVNGSKSLGLRFYFDSELAVSYGESVSVNCSGSGSPQVGDVLTFKGEDAVYKATIAKASGGKISFSIPDGMKTGNYSLSYSQGDITESIGEITVILLGKELRNQKIHSDIRGKDVLYSVYLPKDYSESRTYPVLYMLHGMNGDNNDWLGSGDVNREASYAAGMGEAPEMVVICPDGENWFYCMDSYLEFFFEEFLPEVEKKYHIKGDRANRAVAGLSMGGYGCVYFGLTHPEMFNHVYGCSPAVSVSSSTIPSLTLLASSIKDVSTLPGITLETGTNDFVVSESSVRSFCTVLDARKVKYELVTRSGGHDWDFWKACTPKIVRKVFE